MLKPQVDIKEYQCPVCGDSFKGLVLFKLHQAMNHFAEQVPSTLNIGKAGLSEIAEVIEANIASENDTNSSSTPVKKGRGRPRGSRIKIISSNNSKLAVKEKPIYRCTVTTCNTHYKCKQKGRVMSHIRTEHPHIDADDVQEFIEALES